MSRGFLLRPIIRVQNWRHGLTEGALVDHTRTQVDEVWIWVYYKPHIFHQSLLAKWMSLKCLMRVRCYIPLGLKMCEDAPSNTPLSLLAASFCLTGRHLFDIYQLPVISSPRSTRSHVSVGAGGLKGPFWNIMTQTVQSNIPEACYSLPSEVFELPASLELVVSYRSSSPPLS
ncbi:hypothetical protein BD310DRAFT_909446 [Dichomitus squalens]|uniref:Uncharacterized protein n=1 Tax=Dichomitus squalens TaxID=114155 RepID=A0A4Q9PI24_9APHY|nr:hypothetical protein BD310DRAFT_909446 [Dichomitus squalens]